MDGPGFRVRNLLVYAMLSIPGDQRHEPASIFCGYQVLGFSIEARSYSPRAVPPFHLGALIFDAMADENH